MEQRFNKEELLIFLLLYAAHTDCDFTEEEKKVILSRGNSETYNKVKAIFDNMNDYQVIQEILKYKSEYYPTEDAKNELLSDVKEMFYADGEFSNFEREILHLLDRLM